LHDDIGVTSVFVTHDQEEAFEVADRVVVMRGGRIEQASTPQEVFDHPANAYVMDFLGNVNGFNGRLHRGRALLGNCEVHCPEYAGQSGQHAVYVRPHELDIEHHANGSGGLRAKVLHVNPAGSVTRVQLLALELERVVHADLSPERYAELALQPGDTVYVAPRRVRVFSSEPEYSI
jgi:sulfate transport system ATP-binding protein